MCTFCTFILTNKMIQQETCLHVADNSGAKKLICIRIVGGNKTRASLGDVILGIVKTAAPHLIVKKSDVVKAVIVRSRHPLRRSDGSSLRFSDNAAVLIDKENNLRGTRIFGPIARELKEKGFSKIVSLAPLVL